MFNISKLLKRKLLALKASYHNHGNSTRVDFKKDRKPSKFDIIWFKLDLLTIYTNDFVIGTKMLFNDYLTALIKVLGLTIVADRIENTYETVKKIINTKVTYWAALVDSFIKIAFEEVNSTFKNFLKVNLKISVYTFKCLIITSLALCSLHVISDEIFILGWSLFFTLIIIKTVITYAIKNDRFYANKIIKTFSKVKKYIITKF